MTRLITLAISLLPVVAFAAEDISTLPVTGGATSLMGVFTGVGKLLIEGIVYIAAAIMTVGAVIMAAAHGNESIAEKGKKAIIGGLVGFCVVMGSYGIWSVIRNFIYY